jgi:hypothetical protein
MRDVNQENDQLKKRIQHDKAKYEKNINDKQHEIANI